MLKIFQNRNLPKRSFVEIKRVARILFIDDHKFKLIDILKSSGWQTVQWVKDVESISCTEIDDAHIILVDIQGVGKKMKFHDEGLGLTIAIKDKYPEKKVITYSSEEAGKIAAFHEGLSKADSAISKNADPYQFEKAIEKHAQELYSLDECVVRIEKIITNELGYSPEHAQIKKALSKLKKKKSIDTEAVNSVLKISGSAATLITSIVKIFFTS
jgi:hypothetical protein